MENTIEGQEPQNTPDEETITLSKAELEDLKHKADVSSQNFARLKKAEEENETLKSQLSNNVPSDNFDMGMMQSELSDIKGKLAKQEVLELYPKLKEVWGDFESYCTEPENKGMSLTTSAKAFLVEKGLLEQKRKGLEKPTGGPRQPIPSGMTAEDVKTLRETNWKKYQEMLMKGQIKM